MAVTFRTNMRAAAMSLLDDYAASISLGLQTYRGRPASIHPPTAFVDSVNETILYTGPLLRQRTPTVEVVVIHGTFDSGVTVDQADAFADGFLDWVTANVHEAGANTTIGAVAIADEPTYVPDWLPPQLQRTYYATRISLEGYVED
jgi:hypothetical protein